jgi:predicted Zn-dependent protease
MLLNEDDAKLITDKILSYSKADSASVSLSGRDSKNLRFALNTVSTCGAVDSVSVNITSNFGKRSGSVNITEIDDKSLESGVRLSEEISKLSPESEEFMPPPEKQRSYLSVNEYFEDTEKLTPSGISEKVSYTINESVSRDLISAGYFETSSGFSSLANSNGLSAYNKNTYSGFSSTVRTRTGNGSSKINRSYADIKLLDVEKFSDRVIERAVLSKDPQQLEAGKYVTILDNSAVCDMLFNLFYSMNRRSADEGRSYFSEKEDKNKIGQKLFSSEVNIFSDPQSREAPAAPFSSDGFPLYKRNWITGGILNNLYTTRYWAKKTESEYVPFPTNVLMTGTDKSIDDLISSTERGIFVTRLWYIRSVDRKQMLLTGLTRDGVFLIEDGKIKHPVNNFRFNESPANVLNNIVDMSVSEKSVGSETGEAKLVVPALKLSEFNFSTVSDAF